MANNVIDIREFVDVSTSVEASPTSVARDWGAVLFVKKGTDAQTTSITKYENLEALVAGEGSNTEAVKFGRILYGSTYNGISLDAPIYVATIGMATASEFTANFTPLLASENYYYIGLDTSTSDAYKKAAATLNQANQTTATHILVLDDTSATVFNTTLAEDIALDTSMSVAAYVKSNNMTTTAVVAINSGNTNKYYSAAMIAYFATRKFEATSRQMATIAHKPCSGISAIDFTDSTITVGVGAAWDNLDEKNCNAYINVKLVGLSAWERGLVGSGDDITDHISAHYLNYVVSVSVFQLLQSVPRLAMNSNGSSLLANTLDGAFGQLYASGIIGPGTSLDGTTFSGKGYSYSIPLPTGVNKANGLWNGIYCEALLVGSCKKVTIGNSLKK